MVRGLISSGKFGEVQVDAESVRMLNAQNESVVNEKTNARARYVFSVSGLDRVFLRRRTGRWTESCD